MTTAAVYPSASIALTDDELSSINGGSWPVVGAFLLGLAVNYVYDSMGGASGINSAVSSAGGALLAGGYGQPGVAGVRIPS